MTAMRSLRRSVAHHRMALAGYSRVNKHGKGTKSFFSKIWYDYLVRTRIANHKEHKYVSYKAAITALSK